MTMADIPVESGACGDDEQSHQPHGPWRQKDKLALREDRRRIFKKELKHEDA
jgi:hypothetical protein